MLFQADIVQCYGTGRSFRQPELDVILVMWIRISTWSFGIVRIRSFDGYGGVFPVTSDLRLITHNDVIVHGARNVANVYAKFGAFGHTTKTGSGPFWFAIVRFTDNDRAILYRTNICIVYPINLTTNSKYAKIILISLCRS